MLGKETFEKLASQVEFPPLNVVEVDYAPALRATSDYQRWMRNRPDLLVDLEWQGEREQFLVELKQRSTPSDVEGAIRQLQGYLQAFAPSRPGRELRLMVMAPYLSPEALDRLSAENISGIDFSGNGVVTIPGKWFVYRTGAPNRFPSSAPIKNVFSGSSSLVARAFLLRREFPSVGEVQEEISRRGGSISLPTVSKVLKTLEEELIIGKGETIRLLDAKRLLDQLLKNYREPRVRRRLKIKVGSFEDALSQFKSNADRDEVLVAGDSPSRYVVMPSVDALRIYTSSTEGLLRGVDFEETTRFPSFELVETSDQTVYFDRRKGDGFYWTSPIQVYLELAAGGKREQETAAQLREDLLEFRFGVSE
jgi:hypothetical protein